MTQARTPNRTAHVWARAWHRHLPRTKQALVSARATQAPSLHRTAHLWAPAWHRLLPCTEQSTRERRNDVGTYRAQNRARVSACVTQALISHRTAHLWAREWRRHVPLTEQSTCEHATRVERDRKGLHSFDQCVLSLWDFLGSVPLLWGNKGMNKTQPLASHFSYSKLCWIIQCRCEAGSASKSWRRFYLEVRPW